jgi:transcription antitermination factor NusG
MTQPRAAVKVGKRLGEINIENFVPLQRQLRQWHDRKKWIEVPMFNYYIFAHLNPRKKNEVFNVMGITKFLTLDGKICIISDTEIERIHRLCSYSGTISLQKGTLKEGDEVDIMEGHFIGLRGKVIKTSTNQKVTISIPSLNCLATVIIDKKNIQKTFA